jgi:hypothetical protein
VRRSLRLAVIDQDASAAVGMAEEAALRVLLPP